MNEESLPAIIQGGMGVGVSGWRLARAVSREGQLGVVSGTALDVILARRLQQGDPDGHVRRALERFPFPGVAQRILDRYFIPGGKAPDEPFRPTPWPGATLSRHAQELAVAGNFVEVYLAREGHAHLVGVNYLEKIQVTILPSLYGAMLAGVHWVLVGAGIPRTIPGILDRLARGQPVELRLDVRNADSAEEHATRFDPLVFAGGDVPVLTRPRFAAIISSSTLGTMLVRRSNGKVDGFVVEGHSAGGHNAPPRGPLQLTEQGEPIYGDRDVPDLEAIRSLGVPFWLAGSYAAPERLTEALDAGAAGIQVGTAFAYCNESDLRPDLKIAVLRAIRSGTIGVLTDPLASPTGFPFKVVQLEHTLSDASAYDQRPRLCDLAYLRHAYKNSHGTLGWRCPAEPLADYLRKGGGDKETVGRKCLCNALLANIGLEQVRREGDHELPLLTSGVDVASVTQFLKAGTLSYSARDVIDHLLSGANSLAPAVSSSSSGY